ncbi:putative Membrane protein [[Clostridium] ultunense Esp]|uniref:hypothetical protein n=1 Tax=Thermicanus aegyptius TaxID=94009 RepID=UPI0002B7073E|nr:hypothetical protein [Thermicanus aegyptius]CCQ96328.1 putative Membrane protein [[Clostridium] ultunense Esp]
MKIIALECRLLQQDFLKFIGLIFSIPILEFLLFAGNGIISPEWTTSEVLGLLYGSVNNYPMNWIYWIFLSFGFLIQLQIVWKPTVHTFELYQLLRYKNASLYWWSKMIVGFLFTVFYLLCNIAVIFVGSLFFHAQAAWDFQWLILLMSLTFNFYVHALLWLTLKLYTLVEVANIVIALLFYAGARIVEPYIPLYYGMKENVHGYLLLVMVLEWLVILLLAALIIRKAKRMDFN